MVFHFLGDLQSHLSNVTSFNMCVALFPDSSVYPLVSSCMHSPVHSPFFRSVLSTLGSWLFHIKFRINFHKKSLNMYKISNIYTHRSSYESSISHDSCGSVGWVSSHKVKGCWFDSRSGYQPGLGLSWDGCGRQLIGDIDVTLPPFLPLFPSL